MQMLKNVNATIVKSSHMVGVVIRKDQFRENGGSTILERAACLRFCGMQRVKVKQKSANRAKKAEFCKFRTLQTRVNDI